MQKVDKVGHMNFLFFSSCDRDCALRDRREGTPRKEYTLTRRLIVINHFLRTYNSLSARINSNHPNQQKDATCLVLSCSAVRSPLSSLETGARETESRDRKRHATAKHAGPGCPKFRMQGCVPTGHWCNSVTTPFPPTGLWFISLFPLLSFVVLFRIPARLGLFQCPV